MKLNHLNRVQPPVDIKVIGDFLSQNCVAAI